MEDDGEVEQIREQKSYETFIYKVSYRLVSRRDLSYCSNTTIVVEYENHTTKIRELQSFVQNRTRSHIIPSIPKRKPTATQTANRNQVTPK